MKNADNTLQLIGRSGTQPTVKQFSNNGTVARFAFAAQEKTTDDTGTERWVIQWHKVVAWGKMAEMVGRLVKKGSKLTIVGKDSVSQFTDNKGNTREMHEIVLYNLSVLDKEPA